MDSPEKRIPRRRIPREFTPVQKESLVRWIFVEKVGRHEAVTRFKQNFGFVADWASLALFIAEVNQLLSNEWLFRGLQNASPAANARISAGDFYLSDATVHILRPCSLTVNELAKFIQQLTNVKTLENRESKRDVFELAKQILDLSTKSD